MGRKTASFSASPLEYKFHETQDLVSALSLALRMGPHTYSYLNIFEWMKAYISLKEISKTQYKKWGNESGSVWLGNNPTTYQNKSEYN